MLLLANLVVGLNTGDLNGAAARLISAERDFRLRRDSGATKQLEELEQARDEAVDAYQPLRKHVQLHMLLGISASLVAVLVNSITVTYFVGTTRWCREVCDTYSLGDDWPRQSDALKRTAFPWSVTGIMAVMVIVAFGAASDPGAMGPDKAARWVSVHFMAAIIGCVVICYAFYRQARAVGANYDVIRQITDKVQQIRQEQGWDEE